MDTWPAVIHSSAATALLFERVFDIVDRVIRFRFERGVAASRARYVEATERLRLAQAAWLAAGVPVEVVDGTIPRWTAQQQAATERLAAAWAELSYRRRQWEAALRDLGHQR